jgi:hypothetical protein
MIPLYHKHPSLSSGSLGFGDIQKKEAKEKGTACPSLLGIMR